MNSEDIESLLECSVCLEQLDETHKVLPCQHTFCCGCLERIIRKSSSSCKGSYLCPECRSECSTPLEDLPTNIILNRILENLVKKPSSSSAESPPSRPPPPRPSKAPSSTNRAHQVYRALYDYKPVQSDELELQKSQLYIVVEKRSDAWFKGYSLQSLKTGFFPGNYVQHVRNDRSLHQQHIRSEEPGPTSSKPTSNSSGSKDIDLIDLRGESLHPPILKTPNAFEENLLRISPPPRPLSSSSREKLKCIVPFPASGKYELNMVLGDVVILISKREDGWCKGTLERTGQVGLFPYSFVEPLK
eukprot:TRINITY_DN5642_c0_g1_i1.p1 TRINITY_DN5642_c0_g1~~TRINITY_DN5642_c0_g1_i1.p1  ORF type:complete len:302 (+),score=74.88 TRINITY_DN5642_c0_g1_i1:89-994(+)